jgi:hypothetical protein
VGLVITHLLEIAHAMSVLLDIFVLRHQVVRSLAQLAHILAVVQQIVLYARLDMHVVIVV